MVAVAESGELARTPFPRLLLDLHRARFEGQLTLRREHVEKRVLFDAGVPVFAESNASADSLSAHLLEQGALSPAQQQAVSTRVQRSGCKEDAALLEMKLLGPRELFVALKEQVRRRIVECFSWEDGRFEVDPSVHAQDDARPFRADLYPLIQDGIAKYWRIDRVLVDLEPRMALYPKRTARLAAVEKRLRVDEPLAAFLAAIDGATTLWNALRLATTPLAAAGAWLVDAAEVLSYRDVSSPREDGAAAGPEIELVFDGAAPERPVAAASPGAAAAVPSGSNPALEAEIDDKHARLDELTHYELLGVAADADRAEIRRAYLLAAKTYHPDALARAGLSGALRTRANRVFAAISRAHSDLTDPGRRSAYDRRLASDAPELDADRLANAETLFRKGEILLKQGNFKMALEFLLPAAELWPDEADYQSAAGWALYKKLPSDPGAAREHLEQAMRLSPDDAVVVFRLSVVLRALGDEDAAGELLARAQRLDPKVTARK